MRLLLFGFVFLLLSNSLAVGPSCPAVTQKLTPAAQRLLENIGDYKSTRYTDTDRMRAMYLAQMEFTVKAIKQIVETIVEKFPPNQFYVLGIGSSPAPIIAMLQAHYENYATNVPYGRTRFSPNSQEAKVLKQHLHSNFKKFLPSAVQLGKKRLVLLDFVMMGDSLKEAQQDIETYLKEQKEPRKVLTVALRSRYSASQIDFTETIQLDWLSDIFYRNQLKPLAEYPSFITGYTDSEGFTSSSAYLDLVKFYRSQP